MTQLTVAAAAASSVRSPTTPDNAFDSFIGGNAFWWANGFAPQWLRADLGVGNAAAATWYSVVPYPGDSLPPTSWTFEGSNDASVWTVLDTQSGVTYSNGSENRTYSFTNSTPYRYYRLNLSAPTTAGGTSSVGLAVAELRFGTGGAESWLFGDRGPGTVLTGAYTIGVVFVPAVDGVITHFTGYRANQGGTVPFGIYNSAGALLASNSIAITSVPDNHWFRLALGTPLAVTAGTPYMVTAYYPNASAYITGSASSDIVSGDLKIPANGTVTFGGSTQSIRYANGNAYPTLTAGSLHLVGVQFRPNVATTTTATALGDLPGLDVAAAVTVPPVTTVVATADLPGLDATSAATVPTLAAVTADLPGLDAVAAANVLTLALVDARADLPGLDATAAVTPIEAVTATATADLPGLDATSTTVFPSSAAATVDLPDLDALAFFEIVAPVAVELGVDLPGLDALVDVVLPGATIQVAADADLPGLDAGAEVYIDAPPVRIDLWPIEVDLVDVIPLVSVTPHAKAVPVTRTSFLMEPLTAEHQVHTPREEGSCLFGDNEIIGADGDLVIGYPQLWIGGRNVTNLRGLPTPIKRWAKELPGWDSAAAWEFPQIRSWDDPDDPDVSPDLDFLQPDAEVVIGLTWRPGQEQKVQRVWTGFYDAEGRSMEGEDETYDYEAKGTLWAAQHQTFEPEAITEPTDIWVLIARALNQVEGARWGRTPEAALIGITSMSAGSRDQKVLERVTALLAEAVTDDYRQWTLSFAVPGKVIRPRLKPLPSHVDATISVGTPGVDVGLRIDQSSRVDSVKMRGITKNGGGWANIYHPWLRLLVAPPYPNDDARNMQLGDTDADTDSGNGITLIEERLNDLGQYGDRDVDGVFDRALEARVRDFQEDAGIQIDGSPGPQTWNALFDRSNEVLDWRAIRLPVAAKPWVAKYRRDADGAVIGPNPNYDPTRVVREIAVDIGPRHSLAEGKKIGRKILKIWGEPKAAGTIVWRSDPNEGDRTDLDLLSNIRVRGHRGRAIVTQVGALSVELDAGSDDNPAHYVVTTTVDEGMRDAAAIEDVFEQRRSAQPDPARMPGNPNRSSRNVNDQRIPWDAESKCGILPRTAVNGAAGLPSIIPVPFAERGKLAGIRLHATRPFAFGLLASGTRMPENELKRIQPNPFASDNPFRSVWSQLSPYGPIEFWGQKGDRCGFSPSREGEDGASFTQDFILESPVDYWTEANSIMGVAVWLDGGSGFVWGRFIPAYEV